MKKKQRVKIWVNKIYFPFPLEFPKLASIVEGKIITG